MQQPVIGKAALAVLYLSAFVAAFNENIINVALVDISQNFGVTELLAQWLVTGYMVVTSVVIALTAYLLKRFSLRKLFFAAGACFIAGEAVCLVAPSFALLLAARLVQAIGSGLFIPIMMNTVLSCVPKERVGSYLAIGSAAITIGPAFAPVISGVAVTFLGWRGIFITPLVATIALLIAGIALVRDYRHPSAARLDGVSVLLAAVGLTILVYGLGQLTIRPLTALGAICIAVLSIWLFARRQKELPEPLLDMAPLKTPLFTSACVLNVIAMMTTFSMSVLLPLYYENVHGCNALMAGLFILVPIAANAVIAIFAGRIMDSRGEWPLLPIGYACIVVGQSAVAALAISESLVGVIAASVVVYAGVGLAMSPVQTSGLSLLRGPQKPSGVSIMNVLLMVAGSLGPSLFVGILSNSAATSSAAGNPQAAAQAAGFSHAVLVAALIAGIALVVSIVHARRVQKVERF